MLAHHDSRSRQRGFSGADVLPSLDNRVGQRAGEPGGLPKVRGDAGIQEPGSGRASGLLITGHWSTLVQGSQRRQASPSGRLAPNVTNRPYRYTGCSLTIPLSVDTFYRG